MKQLSRMLTEVGFILFLFYANLLMGEYEHSGQGPAKGLPWAIWNMVTPANFAIALLAGVTGYGLFEFIRKRV